MFEDTQNTPLTLVVEEGNDEPIQQNEANHNVDLCPPAYDKWTADEGNLVPVKSENPHPKSGYNTEELVDNDVI